MPKQPDIKKLQAALHQLNLEQARQLYSALGAIVEALEQHAATPTADRVSRREVVETQRLGDCLYQLERVRCGKVGCKCAGAQGALHGPYWYAYWRDDGKLRSRYVGKQLREIE